MGSICILPAVLQGELPIPPSKSLCHRAVIAAGLAEGDSRLEGYLPSEDIKATCMGMTTLGAGIGTEGKSLYVHGKKPIPGQHREIDCGESGSTLRFLIPVSLLVNGKTTFTGRGKLGERPLEPYYELFERQGILWSGRGLPLTVEGALKPGSFELRGDISSQFVTGLLMALPLLESDSSIHISSELESRGYIDLTLDVLKTFGIQINNHAYREFYIRGGQVYTPTYYTVEGDFSQAAFWLAAGILGGGVRCTGLNPGSMQGDRAIADILLQMGADIRFMENAIEAKPSETQGITIDASQVPDLVPILAVVAALSKGTTRIINAARVRIKESDRLSAIADGLSRLGADIEELPDGLIIGGKPQLRGGTVESFNDHRIAMALAIASIKCTEPVIIRNSECVKKSYPEFFRDFTLLGGVANEWNMG